MPISPAPRHRLVALLTLLVLGAAGCSSSTSSASSVQPTASTTSSASPGDSGPDAVPTRVKIGKVSGIAAARARKKFRKAIPGLEKRVGTAVDGWFDNAFVGVSYPRTSFPDAFGSFTAQAAADAAKQKALMTNARLGNDISAATALARHVTLDVLAPGGTIAASTARFRLVFDTTGKKQKKVMVSGSLFLTRSHGTWKIFGFDVAKGARR